MDETASAGGPALPGVPVPLTPPRQYEADRRDRVLLPLAWLMGVLLVELCVWTLRIPGAVVPVLVACWYLLLIWYRGAEGLAKRENLLLLAAVGLLALSFALFSNSWFRFWNLLALPVLMAVQFCRWAGKMRHGWTEPTMLWESFLLTIEGLFCRLGAPVKALKSVTGHRRWLYVLGGLAVAVPVLLLVCPLLTSADPLFRRMTQGLADFLREHFAAWTVKLAVGACLAPFLFGLLYALRRPEERKGGRTAALPRVDAALAVTVLAVMDVLYVFFVAVQFAGLFGGDRYLAQTGISYADYARSGFFQLVTVSCVNLTLCVACVHFTARTGGLWRAVQVLASALVAASVVMLASAAWRMTLYVGMYGLSLKRFLTYWGMAMLAVFLTAALLKIWRCEFSFFKVLFAAGVAGWLVVNFINVDRIVARYNVSLYQRGAETTVDLGYLAYLSYDTLDVLETLPGQLIVECGGRVDATLTQIINERRQAAQEDASHWQTWSVSAQLEASNR